MVQNFTPLALTTDQLKSPIHSVHMAKKVLLAVSIATVMVFVTLIVLLLQRNLSNRGDAGSLRVYHVLSS